MTIALVPAAGASRRMGWPKLLLPWGAVGAEGRGGAGGAGGRGQAGRPHEDSTVIGALTSALRAGGAGTVLVVAAPGDAELLAWAAGARVAWALNPHPERGMLSSVLAGLAALGGGAAVADRGEVLLVSPGDLPALRASTVACLLERRAASGAPLALPRYRGRRGHPLAIAPALIPEIETLDPAVGLRQLRDRHAGELLEVEVDDPGCVGDVDTREDYERARGEMGPG